MSSFKKNTQIYLIKSSIYSVVCQFVSVNVLQRSNFLKFHNVFTLHKNVIRDSFCMTYFLFKKIGFLSKYVFFKTLSLLSVSHSLSKKNAEVSQLLEHEKKWGHIETGQVAVLHQQVISLACKSFHKVYIKSQCFTEMLQLAKAFPIALLKRTYLLIFLKNPFDISICW